MPGKVSNVSSNTAVCRSSLSLWLSATGHLEALANAKTFLKVAAGLSPKPPKQRFEHVLAGGPGAELEVRCCLGWILAHGMC